MLEGAAAKFPGSLLGPETITVVAHADGPEVTIKPASFRAVVAGDLPADMAAAAAAGQRPLRIAAMTEPVRAAAPASIPKYAPVGSRDRAIAPAVSGGWSNGAARSTGWSTRLTTCRCRIPPWSPQ